jgi:serine/threonine protein phosphatase PrpC
MDVFETAGMKVFVVCDGMGGHVGGQIASQTAIAAIKEFIGRDMPVDVCIPDNEVSGKHFSILYRSADGKFKFKDEQSSNGTFLNEVLTDEGELSSFDVIKIGSTRLIFIAIPQLPQSVDTIKTQLFRG